MHFALDVLTPWHLGAKYVYAKIINKVIFLNTYSSSAGEVFRHMWNFQDMEPNWQTSGPEAYIPGSRPNPSLFPDP